MSGEPYETLSAFGSVFKGNVCSMNWRLKKVSGDENGLNVVLQHISNNYDVDPPDIHARINFVFNELGALDAATVERTSLKAETEELWRFLSNQLEPLEATNIAVVLGMALYDVKRSLSRLEDKKLAAHTTENNRDYWVALQQEDDDD
jgi:Fic family protein